MEIENQEKEIKLCQEPIVYSKGEEYFAGDGININDENVISVDTDTIQEKLTAGENITIDENNVISATGGGTSDFNNLTNRPQYNGSAMTGSTNIPKVPTKTSDLTNDGADGTSTYVEADSLATVATTGNYSDLNNKPTIPTVLPDDYFTANATSTSTASSSLSLTDTLNAKFEDVKLYGDTKQQTYTGKNLFDKNNYNLFNGYFNGSPTGTIVANANNDIFYIPCQPNTTYSVSKITSLNFAVAYSTVVPSNGSAFAGRVSGNSEPNLTITTDASAGYLLIWARNGNISGEVSRNDVLDTLQIEIGSPSAYEPYVGGVPAPNPDYPQAINVVTGTQTAMVVGKNLFDKNNVNGGNYYIDSNQHKLLASANTYSCYIPIEEGVTYTVSKMVTSRFAIATTQIVPAANVATADEHVGNTSTSLTLTASAGAKYLVIYFYRDLSDTMTIADIEATLQIEKGPTATIYEPYEGQSYTVRLGSLELAKIGDYQDYIYKSGDDWYVHKETGKVTFTGAAEENWSTGLSGDYRYFMIPFSDIVADRSKMVFSNNFKYYSNNEVNGIWGTNNGRIVIFSPESGGSLVASTTSGFMTWLSSNNTTVYYALNTPTDTKITDADLISDLNALANGNTYDGETNIIITATGTNLPALLKAEYYSKSLAGMSKILSEKQDKLIAGANITIDGNIISAIGGSDSITTLTDDDVNYTLNGTDYIAVWLLSTGTYSLSPDATVSVLVNVVDEGGTYTEGMMYDSSYPNIFFVSNSETPGSAVDFSLFTAAPESSNAVISYDTGELIEEYYFVQEPFDGTDGYSDGTSGLVPAPTTSDVGKFLKADGTWDTAGGGPTVVQTTGTSETDVMSQKAVTDTLFKNNDTTKTQIGYNADASGGSYYPAVAIGQNAKATGGSSTAIGAVGCTASGSSSVAIGRASASSQGAIAIGYASKANNPGSIAIGGYSGSVNGAIVNHNGSIALGVGASTTVAGEMNIGDSTSAYGYNNSAYRLLSGVYDGQSAHDVATVGQINATIDAINTALSTNIPHIGA